MLQRARLLAILPPASSRGKVGSDGRDAGVRDGKSLTDDGGEAARHIVDQLIEERAPGLLGRPIARGLVRRLLYPKLGYHAAKAMAERIRELPGAAVMDLLAAELALDVQVAGLARLPASGRVIVAANHPTGLADGVAV